MVATLTKAIAAKALRDIIKDYNYWGESEADSPLTIKSSRIALDDKKILSLDASARRAAAETPAGYKAPERTIRTESLSEAFMPLAVNSLTELQTLSDSVKNEGAGLETLEKSAEAVEFYVQLYSTFSMLNNPRVCYVEDSSDPYTGLFVIGESSDNETVYAQALLVQT